MKVLKLFEDLEIRRKIVHILGISFAIAFAFLKDIFLIGLVILNVIFMLVIISLFYKYFKMFKFLEKFERKDDLRMFPAKGAIMYFVGILIVLVFTRDLNILLISILILSLSDGFATIVGRRYGKHRLPYNKKKSFEGTLTFFIISYIILSLFTKDLYFSLLASFMLAILESLNLKVDDNLLIPVATASLLLLFP